MIDNDPDPDADAGVPDSDPTHIDPAGDLADLVESGEFDIELEDGQDAEDLRAFLNAAERGEIAADPGTEAIARIVRSLLDDLNDADE